MFVFGSAVAGAVIVVAMSACGVTVVVAVELLLPGLGSVVPGALTVAVLVIVPPVRLLVTTSVTVAVAPLAIVPIVQVTGAVPLHVPCVEVADTNVVPAGRGSVMMTLGAVSMPRFETAMEYVMVAFGLTVAGAVFVTERSEEGMGAGREIRKAGAALAPVEVSIRPERSPVLLSMVYCETVLLVEFDTNRNRPVGSIAAPSGATPTGNVGVASGVRRPPIPIANA